MKNASDTVLHDADNYDVIIWPANLGLRRYEGMPHEMMVTLLNKWQGIFAANDLQVYGCGDKMFVEFARPLIIWKVCCKC